MHPLLFVSVLAALSLAMVVVLVRVSRLYLEDAQPWQRWAIAYAAIWFAIVAWCVAFAGPAPMVFLIPIAFLAVHAAILRFALALKHAPAPVVDEIEDEEEEEEEEEDIGDAELPAPQLSIAERIAIAIRNFVKWVITLAVVLVIIGIGENIPALHRLHEVLAPHRTALVVLFGVLLAIGFATFMISALRPLFEPAPTATERGIEAMHAQRVGLKRAPQGEISLRELRNAWHDGTWRDRRRVKRFLAVIAGVALALLSAAALGLVLATPGLKLLILLILAFVLFQLLRAPR